MDCFQCGLSYAASDVDPGLDPTRDEGESRLRKLRPLLRVATKTAGLEDFLTAGAPSALSTALAPQKKDFGAPSALSIWEKAEHGAVLDSLLLSDYDKKPTCALLTPTVHTLSITEADALDEPSVMALVPLKREDRLAVPGVAPKRVQCGSVVVRWPRGVFSVCKEATKPGELRVDRVGAKRVRFTVHGVDGALCENLYASDIPEAILDALFAPALFTTIEKPLTAAALRLPKSEGELPEFLQLQLAGFAQLRRRAHVLTAAAGPVTTSRPMWFETMKLTWRKCTKKKPASMCIKAYFHPASTDCFCRAHLLGTPEQRFPKVRFTGTKCAVMTIEMCGEAINDDDGLEMGCPTHGPKCQRNRDFAPGVCCSNLSISFSCVHQRFGEGKSYGLFVAGGTLNTFERDELTLLLGACAQYDRASRGLFGPDAPADSHERLERLVTATLHDLESKLRRYDVYAHKEARLSDADMARIDAVALQCLREGGLIQVETPQRQSQKLVWHTEPKQPTADEKKLFKHHHWLFPRPGQPFGTAQSVIDTQLAAVQQTLVQSGEAHQPPAKRPRTKAADFDYETIIEYFDPAGMADMQRQLTLLMADPNLPTKQRERGMRFQQYLTACDIEYGEVEDGPLGLPARALACQYRSRNDGGRLYPTDKMAKAPGWKKGEWRSVCIQSMAREMRPFACCRWAHDFDMVNAQPVMLRQMPSRLSWGDERKTPALVELGKWCDDRTEYIRHVAEVHRLPTDEERHFEYRKDIVKKLMVAMMFGGAYDSWVKKLCEDLKRHAKNEPRSERVLALQNELTQLRVAVFQSIEWGVFVDRDRERLRRKGKKESEEAIDRSVFARVMQKTENEILTVMRRFLREKGWTVLTLCFDGLCIQHRPERTLDLPALNERITKDTGYKIEITEKPLFSPTFPELSLARS
jgi:hypothetical protein